MCLPPRFEDETNRLRFLRFSRVLSLPACSFRARATDCNNKSIGVRRASLYLQRRRFVKYRRQLSDFFIVKFAQRHAIQAKPL